MEERIPAPFEQLRGADSSRMERFRSLHPDGRPWMDSHGQDATWKPSQDQPTPHPVQEKSDN